MFEDLISKRIVVDIDDVKCPYCSCTDIKNTGNGVPVGTKYKLLYHCNTCNKIFKIVFHKDGEICEIKGFKF